MQIQQPALTQPNKEETLPELLEKSWAPEGSFLSMILLAITMGTSLVLAVMAADPGQLLIFYKQARKTIPKLSVGTRSYFPLVELLTFLDLPYSESASAGFVQITVGK